MARILGNPSGHLGYYDVISNSHLELYVWYSTILKVMLTENGSSQGPNIFTYERCPLGHFYGTKDLYMGHR